MNLCTPAADPRGAQPVPGDALPCPQIQHPHTGFSTGTVYSYLCNVQVPFLVQVQRQEQKKGILWL